jgi:Xaa-Pro aminopeptidase
VVSFIARPYVVRRKDRNPMLMQTHEARLDALRKELARRGLDGFVVPISDEHMSEYVGAYAQRLAWLTGFGGSAGTAVVLKDKAAIFVDGRYTVQVREQVDGKLFEYQSVPETSPAAWLKANAPEGARIGYDAWLHSKGWADAAAKALWRRRAASWSPVESNPVDAVWADRPAPSAAPALVQSDAFAGRSSADKRAEVADWLKREGYDAAVISALDSIAWLLNIRGADVERTPVALSYVIAHADGTAELFIAPEKVTPELTQHLGNAVTIRAARPSSRRAESELAARPSRSIPTSASRRSSRRSKGRARSRSRRAIPTILPKAIKNPVEQQGHRDAQARDGAAVTRFLHWLSVEAPKGGETELAPPPAAAFREESGTAARPVVRHDFRRRPARGDPALPGGRGQQPPIAPGSIYLVDSGGQYPTARPTSPARSGSAPGSRARSRRTASPACSRAISRSPADLPARHQRQPARHARAAVPVGGGVDYAHGTGHGVGSFLAVHEGPAAHRQVSARRAGRDRPGADGRA